jgi:hypothetical protein
MAAAVPTLRLKCNIIRVCGDISAAAATAPRPGPLAGGGRGQAPAAWAPAVSNVAVVLSRRPGCHAAVTVTVSKPAGPGMVTVAAGGHSPRLSPNPRWADGLSPDPGSGGFGSLRDSALSEGSLRRLSPTVTLCCQWPGQAWPPGRCASDS